MKTKIKCTVKNLYECTFKSDKGSRMILVVAESFGRAAFLAHSTASGWEDYESFELMRISLVDIVVTA